VSGLDRVIAVWIIVLGCGACSLIRPEATTPSPPVERGVLSLPDRPGYPGELAAVQNIHAVRGDRTADLQAVVEVSPEHLVMVLALPFGSRLATIDWSAQGVSVQRTQSLPAGRAVQPKDVLADLVLAFWPEDVVRESLHKGLVLVVEPGRRQVRRGDEVLVEVRREDADPWNGQTVLDNRMIGYRLTIVSQVAPGA
jgi:hypothetical protein